MPLDTSAAPRQFVKIVHKAEERTVMDVAPTTSWYGESELGSGEVIWLKG
jgi:hypothetical protein